MGKQRGNPGLGTKIESPISHKAEIELYIAPEQPKPRITSLVEKGASGVENLFNNDLRVITCLLWLV